MTLTQIVQRLESAIAASLVMALAAVTPAAAQSAGDLQIEVLELTDSSLDGIFQPGEALALQVVITNPTDRPLGNRLQLTGPGLLLDDEQWIEVPAGSAIRLERPLSAILDPTLEARSETPLRLKLGDTERTLPLWISHPLEFGGDIAVSRSAIDEGSTSVHLVIHNTSRKESAAILQARVAPDSLVEASRIVASLPAESSTEISFELAGVAPELVRDGAVTLEFTAAADGRTHDRLAYGRPANGSKYAGRSYTDVDHLDMIQDNLGLSLPETP